MKTVLNYSCVQRLQIEILCFGSASMQLLLSRRKHQLLCVQALPSATQWLNSQLGLVCKASVPFMSHLIKITTGTWLQSHPSAIIYSTR